MSEGGQDMTGAVPDEWLARLVRAAPAAVLLRDTAGQLVWASPHARWLIGRAFDQLIGRAETDEHLAAG